MLHGKEKIWFLVNRLIDERDITPAGQLIGLHPANDLNNLYLPQDFINLLDKLEKEENAAKFISLPTDQTYLKYQVELLPDFDKYVAKLEEDPGYLEWSGKKPKSKSKGYFLNPESRVDFTKSKKQNQDKYISVGQIEELQKMPEDEQQRIKNESLTDEHVKDIEDYKKSSLELVENIKKNFNIKLPNLKPQLSDVTFALPPNYEAEQVSLLRQLVKQQKDTKPMSNEKVVLSVSYTSSRQVLLNDVFQLAKPNFESENDQVFRFLVANPNKSFTKKQVEDSISAKITKPLHKIVENLGFKGDLAKAFFSVSKNSISFRNPVSKEELEQMGIAKIMLNKPDNS